MNVPAGKADLDGATEERDGVFVREVPESKLERAIAAAESCPIDAIVVYDGDERVAP
jgi:ferredoxin